jgi:lambda repressor-like predicted transcriptional regulator
MGTILAELVDSGEKRDSSGRKIAGDARRAAILAAYDRSGLTQRTFAAREGVSYHTLVTWLVRRRREQPGATAAAAPVRFAEVRMPRSSAGLEVCLPNGIVIRGGDGAQVAALVKILSR